MPGGGHLRAARGYAARLKPTLVRWLLALLCLLGVVAQLVAPLGDMLSGTTYLGGSFAAFIALVLFDAITGPDRPREVVGVSPQSRAKGRAMVDQSDSYQSCDSSTKAASCSSRRSGPLEERNSFVRNPNAS